MRRAGLTDGEIVSAPVYSGGVSAGVDYTWVKFFLGCWSLLFSWEWWDLIQYRVLGSLVMCHWREPVVSRFLGCNR
jgi:hypothetical protein